MLVLQERQRCCQVAWWMLLLLLLCPCYPRRQRRLCRPQTEPECMVNV
jgi:hypothetical protein